MSKNTTIVIVVAIVVIMILAAIAMTGPSEISVRSIPTPNEDAVACEKVGGRWGVWSNALNTPSTCNAATTDAGVVCSNSSECESYCQAPKGAEIDEEVSGTCFGHVSALCMQEVQDGMAQGEWCF